MLPKKEILVIKETLESRLVYLKKMNRIKESECIECKLNIVYYILNNKTINCTHHLICVK